MQQKQTMVAIVVGGSIAASLDIIFAISFAASHGMPPLKLLQTVATGVLGNGAYDGGRGAASLGLGLHIAMSWLWAGAFAIVANKLPSLNRRPWIVGPLFGVVVFFMMRLVVLPLSAYPFPVSFKPLATTLDLLSHMFLFGTPIALVAARELPTERQADLA